MRTGEDELSFPLPCAASPETSFVVGPAESRRAVAAAGSQKLANVTSSLDQGLIARVELIRRVR
jgi:hypothetical protein